MTYIKLIIKTIDCVHKTILNKLLILILGNLIGYIIIKNYSKKNHFFIGFTSLIIHYDRV